MSRVVIGVMGPGDDAQEPVLSYARELGRRVAEEGWVVLSGGRDCGVMDAVSRAAHDAGGLTVGVLPGSGRDGMSDGVDIPIVTGMGSARNNINVLSSDVVVACGISSGTASEIALAINAGKHVILLAVSESARNFFSEIGATLVHHAATPVDAIALINSLLP